MISMVTIYVEVHPVKYIPAALHHDSTQVSREICCYHYTHLLEARKENKAGPLFPTESKSFAINSSHISEITSE